MKRLIRFRVRKKTKNAPHQPAGLDETGSSTNEMSAYSNQESFEDSPDIDNKNAFFPEPGGDTQSVTSADGSVSDVSCLSTISSLPPVECNDENTPSAIALNALMRSGSISTARALSIRTKIIESIIWLGKHVPRCVLSHLIYETAYNRQESGIGDDLGRSHSFYRSTTIQFEDVGRDREKKRNAMSSDMPSSAVSSRRLLDTLTRKQDASMGFVTIPLPNVDKYLCALLFIDISGFTALSVLLDVESLSKAINDYFQMIVDSVISHGGDILKFAGDALFAEWRVMEDEGKGVTATIEDCVLLAATCGAKVVAACTDYPIYSANGGSEDEKIATLNVHCGLGVGELTSVHVGNYHTRRELIVLGDPIDQVSEAEGTARLGELVASPEALSYLHNTCDMTKESMHKGGPMMIASRNQQCFSPMKDKDKNNISQIAEKITKMTFNFEGMDTTSLTHLQRKIALYVHPIVVQSDNANNSFTLYGFPQERPEAEAERYRAEAELRSVYTMFIMPLIPTERTDDKDANTKLYKLLNNIMNLVTDTLESFMGHLRQFIVDDKGVVLIATFGLRGSTTPNMIIERAIPATRFLHRTLKTELGVDNHIGGTIGKAYCGVVGGMLRHEYAVLGPSVNLAARLMSLPKHPGILVDDEVRLAAGKAANFRPLSAVKAKGYDHLVPIFEPLTATERRWGEVNPNFVGRKDEMGMIINLAKNMALCGQPAKMCFLVGVTGSGKSSVIVETIAMISNVLLVSGHNIIVTRNVSNEGDSHVPFSLFRSIFRDVLSELKMQSDDNSIGSYESSYGIYSLCDKDWDRMSSSAASEARTDKSTADRMAYLCKEIGAPKGFLEIVGHHLLGHAKQDKAEGKTANMDEIVNVMAQAFERCISDADLVVLAMDDVHNVDRMSWKVVQKLFLTCDNLLMVCGSRPFSSYPPRIGKMFWSTLKSTYTDDERYYEVELAPLKPDDITNMISKYFNCPAREIDETLSKDVLVQSGAMPYYASEILANIMRQNMCTRLEDGKLGWSRSTDESTDVAPATSTSFVSLDELIVNRIDSLGDSVREILFIAAALGVTFELSEILAVYEQMYSISPNDRDIAANRVCEMVGLAIRENIFEESFDLENAEKFDGVDQNNLDDDSSYDLSLDFRDSERENVEAFGRNQECVESKNLFENKQYRFYHDAWRSNILALLLAARKREILRNAGIALEMRCKGGHKTDYRTKMRLYGYWKGSGCTTKAAELALEIGEEFTSLGLNSDSNGELSNSILPQVKAFYQSDASLPEWKGSQIN